MKRFLLIACLLFSRTAFAQAPLVNGQTQQGIIGCQVAHKDAAVNTLVTVATPQPPNGQSVYICGIDLSVSNDSTGAVTQANVQFTSANLNGWVYTYSTINAANTNGLDKFFYPPFAMKAGRSDAPVSIVSPAINAHAAYSINLYYYFAP